MNTIKALKYTARKEQYELQGTEFPNYQVDGFWLDEALDKHYPNQLINELVPSLLGKFNDKELKESVWGTIFPQPGQTAISPVLTCNQGCGLSCTHVVAEIENTGHSIIWKRLGLKPMGLDKPIQWLDAFANLEFPLEEYERMLKDFQIHSV